MADLNAPQQILQLSGYLDINGDDRSTLFVTCWHPYIVISDDYRVFNEFTKDKFNYYYNNTDSLVIRNLIWAFITQCGFFSNKAFVAERERFRFAYPRKTKEADKALDKLVNNLYEKYKDKPDEIYDILCQCGQDAIKFLKKENNMYMGG